MVCVGGLVKNGVVFLTKGTPDMRANSVGQQSGDLKKKTKTVSSPFCIVVCHRCICGLFSDLHLNV